LRGVNLQADDLSNGIIDVYTISILPLLAGEC
jgi:hypothetical protein